MEDVIRACESFGRTCSNATASAVLLLVEATLESMLRALVVSRQVEVVQVGGQMKYRATM
jgi:hypothetical protein